MREKVGGGGGEGGWGCGEGEGRYGCGEVWGHEGREGDVTEGLKSVGGGEERWGLEEVKGGGGCRVSLLSFLFFFHDENKNGVCLS